MRERVLHRPLAYVASRASVFGRSAVRPARDARLVAVLGEFGMRTFVTSSLTDTPLNDAALQALHQAAIVVSDIVNPEQDV